MKRLPSRNEIGAIEVTLGRRIAALGVPAFVRSSACWLEPAGADRSSACPALREQSEEYELSVSLPRHVHRFVFASILPNTTLHRSVTLKRPRQNLEGKLQSELNLPRTMHGT